MAQTPRTANASLSLAAPVNGPVAPAPTPDLGAMMAALQALMAQQAANAQPAQAQPVAQAQPAQATFLPAAPLPPKVQQTNPVTITRNGDIITITLNCSAAAVANAPLSSKGNSYLVAHGSENLGNGLRVSAMITRKKD